MNSGTPLDYALFQLSPRRSRCELFVSADGKTEKLASGLFKPFTSHLKVAEEQGAHLAQSINLEVEKRKKGGSAWFNKGTLERFVRFVSTPEVLESVNALDTEMSQLEGARNMYSQGVSEQIAGAPDAKGTSAEAADSTKRELLRAIDMRLVAVNQDLLMACSRASAAGFNLDNVPELLLFSDHFGTHRLNVACTKFVSLCKRRPELNFQHHQPQWTGYEDGNCRSSSGSDMSIDKPELEASVLGNLQQDEIASCSGQLQKSTACSTILNQPNIVHRSADGEAEKPEIPPITTIDSAETTSRTTVSASRRLSVQDRINLFENKQKELSDSTNSTNNCVPGGVGGGISRVGNRKTNLRRLSSDGSGEKSVLRRWSGASDMSLDLASVDGKDSLSAVLTPSSSTNSLSLASRKTEERGAVLKDTSTTLLSSSCRKEDLSRTLPVSSLKDGELDTPPKEKKVNSDGMSNIVSEKRHLRSLKQSFADSPVQNEAIVNPVQRHSSDCQVACLAHGSQVPSESAAAATEGSVTDSKEDILPIPRSYTVSVSSGGRCNLTKVAHSKVSSQTDVRVEHRENLNSEVQFKLAMLGASSSVPQEGDITSSVDKSNNSQSQWKSFRSNFGESARKEASSCTTQTQESLDNLDCEDIKLHKRAPSPFHIGNIQICQTGSPANVLVSKSMKSKGSMKVVDPSPVESVEQGKPVRQSKGYQELNDELQMKANELEKLFAAHKLRTPVDQVVSSGANLATEPQVNRGAKTVTSKSFGTFADQSPEVKLSSRSVGHEEDLEASLLLNVNSRDYVNNLNNKLGNLGTSEDLRGKFYEKYMQKRDIKLREVWVSKRVQKEAEMKAMQDILEHSKAEMLAKLAGSANKRDSGHRAEKMNYFNSRSAAGSEDQRLDDCIDQEEVPQEISELAPSEMLPCITSVSSSIPRTPVGKVTRSSIKAMNSGSLQYTENPVAQSMANFSDVRKENTRPSVGASKSNTQNSSLKTTRSRSTIEEINRAKEDKTHRSQSIRKSLATSHGESKGFSHYNLDSDNIAPLKFLGQTDQAILNTAQKTGNSKTFLRRGNGVDPGARTSIARLQASFTLEHSSDILRDEDEDSKRQVNGEKPLDFSVNLDSENPTLSPESRNSRDPVLKTSDTLEVPSHGDDDRAINPSKLNASIGNVEESPTESPTLWNSHTHHQFPLENEASDVDAYVDSPTGSPASWNSHPLKQLIVDDAARMRKKWGSAQVPSLAPNASHQPLKYATKGFKQLLKFGRKNKGSDSLLNDCVSVSTASEGDDDAEDGRELSAQSSDDLRKSRMSHPVSSYEGFIDGEIFHEQDHLPPTSIPNAPANFRLRDDQLSGSSLKAPRSFFSLSSFRTNKGGTESKPR